MVILSDCVKNHLDEGCIKVASTLSKRLVKGGAKLVAVNCDCDYADHKVDANKTYTDAALYSAIKSEEGDILYIPFASDTLGTAIRTFFLSKKTKRRINVLFTLRWDMNGLTKFILKKSNSNILTLSQKSLDFFKEQLPGVSVNNIMTGVDTDKFSPVDDHKKNELREKYGLPKDKCLVMHVGHLKHDRNVDVFLDVDEKYHVLLVFSSVTEQDNDLKNELLKRNNITIIEDYCPDIEELYQMADIYIFPVIKGSNCIDIPLSVLEAAACNKKIIATAYNEIEYFERKDGLMVIKDFDNKAINEYIEKLMNLDHVETRKIAEKYDWNDAVRFLKDSIK